MSQPDTVHRALGRENQRSTRPSKLGELVLADPVVRMTSADAPVDHLVKEGEGRERLPHAHAVSEHHALRRIIPS